MTCLLLNIFINVQTYKKMMWYTQTILREVPWNLNNTVQKDKNVEMQDETLQSVRLNAENKTQLTLKAEGKFRLYGWESCRTPVDQIWIHNSAQTNLINPSN